MIRDIVHDAILLSKKAVPATTEHLSIAADLQETLAANSEICVGMAANMIGFPVKIIAFDDGALSGLMLNPEIIAKSGRYETEEGCLSLSGKRKAIRYKTIKVKWQTTEFQTRIKNFTGFTAQIIEHEIDHLDGILI